MGILTPTERLMLAGWCLTWGALLAALLLRAHRLSMYN